MSASARPRVVVTGVGALTSIGIGRTAFSDGLRRGSSGIGPITSFDVTEHVCKVGGEIRDFAPEDHFDRRELRRMDRASQLLRVAAREAVAAAALDFSAVDPARCGVLVGTTLGGMLSGQRYHRLLKREQKRRPSLLLDFPVHAPTDDLCGAFGFQGPCLTLSAACASGAQVLGCAHDLICADEADVLLAAGVDTLSELTHSGFGALRLLVGEGEDVRPFDLNRSGFALGEGAAVLVVEERERAVRRGAPVLAEIRGYGQSNDAHHMTAPDPEGRGAATAMLDALSHADVSPGQVQYVNAHGTASRHNDLAETRAIRRVFGDDAARTPVSSTKSMIGHTLGASGAIEAAATIVAMHDGFVPPTINYETPDPECDLDFVPKESRPLDVRIAMSNSFGFGGVNCSVVLERVDTPSEPAAAAR